MTFVEIVFLVLAMIAIIWALRPFRQWLEAKILATSLKKTKPAPGQTFETRNYRKEE
jgi:hypothetical protein